MKSLMRLLLVIAIVVGVGVMLNACSRNANDAKDRVDKALDQANIKGVHTSYDRDANVVHLQGTVDSTDAKQRADQVATQAVGTTGNVLDELKVQGMDEKPQSDQDSLIRDTLRDEVSKDQVLQDRSINFDVNNGVVTVKGTVRSAAEKDKINQMVKAVPGVKDMANELEVKPKNDNSGK
jgi:osmotically-inducible protein OsmY